MKPIEILLIEDSDTFGGFLQYYLEMTGKSVTIAPTVIAARQELSTRQFTLIIIDPGMPDSIGIDTYNLVKSLAPSTPRIVLSGGIDKAVEAECVKDGVHYLIKQQDLIDPESSFIKLLHSMVATEVAESYVRPLLNSMANGERK